MNAASGDGPERPHGVADGLDLLLAEPKLAALVRAYFDPEGPFAGHGFDTVGDNPSGGFTEGDLLAVTLLDVVYGPEAVRRLLDFDADRWSKLLAAVPAGTPLWEIDATTYHAADTLWRELVKIPSVGPTKASKLLARKRPALIPIYDDVVNTFLQPGERGLWWELYDALQDPSRRAGFHKLAAGLSRTPSTLRIIDVAIWMRCGNSSNARRARHDVGLRDEPLMR